VFGLEILDFVIENSTFELSKDIIVIDPQRQVNENDENTFFDISQIGLSASVLYVNDNFYKGDGNNLAVIKIKGKDFPSVFISDEKVSITDDNFYTFNTSGVYNFKNINDLENGGIYDLELKASSVAIDEIDTDVLYMDIMLNSQASGGPSFNTDGDIVGILTLEEGSGVGVPVQMLIIPNDIIRATLNKIGIANEDGVYATHFKKGFEYINSERCDEASSEFEKALSLKSPFTKNVALNSYLVECYEVSRLSKESQEKDLSSFFNMIKGRSASLDLLDWIIVVLLVLLGITSLVIFIVMVGKLRKKKEEPYRPSKESRSEEVQKARRAPLSEALPKQEKEDSVRPVGRDVVVLSSDKPSPHGVSQNNISKQKTVLEIKNDDNGGNIPQNLKVTEIQNNKNVSNNTLSPASFS
ncbi:MAG: serine protease, partial [Candidatus Pacebacteria bacterium]|nr:serine protease [Candidatus Paceibacterota bacterium]